jgi:hypothetical protein
MSLLDDIADVLSSGGLGTVGTTIFKGILPSTPDVAISLYETGGGPNVHAMAAGPGTALAERPHLQVVCRHPRTDGAKQAAQRTVQLLDALSRSINGIAYRSVYALQAPFFLQTDAGDRVEYAVNFEIVKDLATSS